MNSEKQINESPLITFIKICTEKLKLTSFILDQTSKLKSGGKGLSWPPETFLWCTTEQGVPRF